MALRDYLAGEVAEDFSDGLVDRREALRRLGLLGLSVTGAAALLAACGGDGDSDREAAATTAAGGASTTAAQGGRAGPGGGPAEGELVRFAGPSGELQAAWAAPSAPEGAVLVIHENRGLTHPALLRPGGAPGGGGLRRPVRRPAVARGRHGVAGRPGRRPRRPQRRVRGAAAGRPGRWHRRAPTAGAGPEGRRRGVLLRRRHAWALVQSGEPRLAAVVPFYGPAPDDPDFSRSTAAVLGIYAGRDTRVNASRDRAAAALERAGLVHRIRTFEGAEHAFFNDTSPRHHPQAAAEAWSALLAWFGEHLA